MRYTFNYQKYRAWRIAHDKLNEDTLDTLDTFDSFSTFNGMDRNELGDAGLIILKEWCDVSVK